LELARVLGASFGFLGEAANSVGAYIAGAWPQGAGMNAAQMLAAPRHAYVLLNVEAELDSYDAQQALSAMMSAQMVVALSAFKHLAADYADVMLPIAPFTETSGTFINTEGRVQSFNAVVKPRGECRPAWKVLRVLGNLLQLPGFDYNSTDDVRKELLASGETGVPSLLDNALTEAVLTGVSAQVNGIERIGEVPIYQSDAIVRRASSLQATQDAALPRAWLNAALMLQIGVNEDDAILLKQGAGQVHLAVGRDDGLPDNCVRVAAAHPITANLGGMFGAISVERA
jgi:NADH-quinone oxidoreductase subunit G